MTEKNNKLAGNNVKLIVSVVLGTYNRLSFLKRTLESVRENGIKFPYEIIVIDGGSTDGTLKYLSRQKDIITIIQHNRGMHQGKPVPKRSWGYFMNLGFKIAHGKYICMISDDCLLIPDAVNNGISLSESLISQGRNIGAVAFYWRNWPEQSDYCVGLTLADKMFVNHGLFLRDAVKSIDWIDEETYKFYHADGDLALRLWQNGYEVIDSPNSFVEHFSHSNLKVRQSNLEDQKKDWNIYLNKWEGIFYSSKKENIGSWIYKPYYDGSCTAKKFPIVPKTFNFLKNKIVAFVR